MTVPFCMGATADAALAGFPIPEGCAAAHWQGMQAAEGWLGCVYGLPIPAAGVSPESQVCRKQ